jgi:HSP20 family protein
MAIKRKTAPKTKTNVKKRAAKTPAPTHGLLEPLTDLRQEIDRVFDDFFQGWPRTWPRFPSLFEDFDRPFKDWQASFGMGELSPNVDLSESEDAYTVTAELPGLDEKDIELTLADGMLTLKGEKKVETDEKKKDYHFSERKYGSFRRTFRMPSGVDDSQVEADFTKGLLTITLPKTKESKEKTRKIEVKKS